MNEAATETAASSTRQTQPLAILGESKHALGAGFACIGRALASQPASKPSRPVSQPNGGRTLLLRANNLSPSLAFD